MEISLCYEGSELFTLTLPDKTKSIDLCLDIPESNPYGDIYLKMPVIKTIEFHEEEQCIKQ